MEWDHDSYVMVRASRSGKTARIKQWLSKRFWKKNSSEFQSSYEQLLRSGICRVINLQREKRRQYSNQGGERNKDFSFIFSLLPSSFSFFWLLSVTYYYYHHFLSPSFCHFCFSVHSAPSFRTFSYFLFPFCLNHPSLLSALSFFYLPRRFAFVSSPSTSSSIYLSHPLFSASVYLLSHSLILFIYFLEPSSSSLSPLLLLLYIFIFTFLSIYLIFCFLSISFLLPLLYLSLLPFFSISSFLLSPPLFYLLLSSSHSIHCLSLRLYPSRAYIFITAKNTGLKYRDVDEYVCYIASHSDAWSRKATLGPLKSAMERSLTPAGIVHVKALRPIRVRGQNNRGLKWVFVCVLISGGAARFWKRGRNWCLLLLCSLLGIQIQIRNTLFHRV